MARDWSCGELLKVVFPLLDCKDLASCMLVCRQWRDFARDDFLWKRICAKRWPSLSKRPPAAVSYYKLFMNFCKPRPPQPLLPSKLSFNVLEFYIDIWCEKALIFSEAVSGSAFCSGIQNPPDNLPDTLKAHLSFTEYKMIVQAEPRLSISFGQEISVSVFVSRKDTNQIACIVNQSLFEYVDSNAHMALAYDYLKFSPRYPFISGIRTWVSLLFLAGCSDNSVDVFAIEIDFCDAANTENEVLWLIDMLDWK